MLRFLSVRNLAVIDRLEIEFEPGLNVLTGETGAGKSILVGAVGLLVGGRASGDLVRTGEETAAVEAIFETPTGAEVIVRREVSAQGRSRASIDGALATSAALRDLCAPLVDLHGQHDHQLLLDPAAHLDLLDAFAEVDTERSTVAAAFASLAEIRSERDRLLTGEREKAARAEFITFQLAEIDRVSPKPAEDEELSAARVVLANADKLQRLCADAYEALYEGDQAVLPALGVVWKRVADLAALDGRFGPYLEARATLKPQLEDLAFFLRSYSAAIDASPARLQEVEDRLAHIERLKKKHGPTLDDVTRKMDSLQRELHDIEHATERAATLDRALAAAKAAYVTASAKLTARRQAAAADFARRLEASLKDLAMNRTRCEVRLNPAEADDQWSERGMETAEFYLSPNPGEDLKPLARIASGGELSRVMLALKTLASTDEPGKTLIFDEVDAGIGGAVADVVGARLQRLGNTYQVLCITHLPQIAAYGRTHYRIEKNVRGRRTVTDVARVDGVQREEELARMIGGSDVSPTVIASAREMLAFRRGRERSSSGGTRAVSPQREQRKQSKTN
jgi:DNA repair protein RecN (Recombination protein N)